MVREHGRLFSAFVRKPAQTGAIVPSSRGLTDRMVEDMGLERARTVVELGPGTGVFTRAIAERAAPDALLLAFEINPELAARLVGRFPRVRVINASAEHVARHLAACGREHADCVISGLPWAVFPREQQERVLGAVADALRPGGRFATFAYITGAWLPPGLRFRALLGRLFAKVETTPVVWRNVPPAFVYRCEK